MPNSVNLSCNAAGVFTLAGEMTFANVEQLLDTSKSLLAKAATPIQIDLSQVTQSDSAGVALLVSWMRAAKQQQKTLHLLNLPAQMQAIVQVSGLTELLKIENRE